MNEFSMPADLTRNPLTWRALFLRGDRLHPLWRVALFLTALVLAETAIDSVVILLLLLVQPSGLPAAELLSELGSGQTPRLLFLGVSVLRLPVYGGLALLLGRLLDREPAATMGLSTARAGRDGLLGLLIGLAAMLLVAAARLALGWATLQRGGGSAGLFLLDLLALLAAAAAEEIAFRGYVQRAIAAWKGPLAGVLVSAALFSFAHVLNPNVNVVGVLNIVLAGVVFALAVERRGTLWLATGYHLAWNLAQGALLGMPVSGMAWDGLLALSDGGPALLTGGTFGPEGGLLATTALLLSLLPLLWATRGPATVVPAYRRQRAEAEARFGPLPHRPIRVTASDLFDGELQRKIQQGQRLGEVVLLLRRADGQVLLHTKHFYPPDVYRLPSGGINGDESVVTAAQREACEETGLELCQARPLGVLTYDMRQGRQSFFFHSWLVTGQVDGQPAPQDEHERITGYRWVDAKALPEITGQLRRLPDEWAGWGQYRAHAHDAAATVGWTASPPTPFSG